MFGGVGLSSVTAKSTIIDGLTNGSSLSSIAGSLLQQGLGISTDFVNPVTFFLKDAQTGSNLQIPVNPEQVTIKWDRQYETVSILNLGEVDFTTGDKIQEISFNSFFPSEYVPNYCKYADIPSPLEAHQMMNSWKSRAGSNVSGLKDPIQLIITGAMDINMPALVTHYEGSEKGGEPGDIYYSITIREWKEVAVRTEAEQKTAKRTDLAAKPKTAKVKLKNQFSLKEELFKVAKLHYGRGESLKSILNANTSQLTNSLTKDLAKSIKVVLP